MQFNANSSFQQEGMKPQTINRSMNLVLDMNSDSQSIEQRIIEKLAKRHALGTHTIHKDVIESYFSIDDQRAVDNALKKLIRDPKAPVTTGNSRKDIKLTSQSDAMDYLAKEGVDSKGIQYYHQLLHQADTGGLSDEVIDTDFPDDLDEDTKYILNELKQDNKESREAAESWRAEARRRQKISLIVGIVSFVFGIGLRHIAPLFF